MDGMQGKLQWVKEKNHGAFGRTISTGRVPKKKRLMLKILGCEVERGRCTGGGGGTKRFQLPHEVTYRQGDKPSRGGHCATQDEEVVI